MRTSKIIYDPLKSIHQNALDNGVSDDGIKFYIKQNKINRRLENKVIIVNDIRKYLKKHPSASKKDVSIGTDYSVVTIRKYWKAAKGEEQLVIDGNGDKNLYSEGITKDNVIKSIGNNQDKILTDILKLYVHAGYYDCDLTYSVGGFYKAIRPPKYKFDKYPLSDDVKPLSDVYSLGYEVINSVVIDLPFIIKSNEKDAATARMVERFQCFYSIKELTETNQEMLSIAFRLLKKGGILVQKVQNTVYGNKQVWTSFITQIQAQNMGFTLVDEFVLEGKSRLLYYPEDEQKHARKYHSYFLVFKKTKSLVLKEDELNNEDYEETILDGIKFKLYKPYEYKLQDIVQFHSHALLENQVMSNHYNCIVKFRGVEFYGFEMMFHSMKFAEHPEILKEVMAASSAVRAKKKSMQYRNLYFDGVWKERWYRVYVLAQLFKYLSVKEYRDRLRELRGQTLVECPNGHGTSAEATQNLDTNIFHGRNYSGRFTMLIRDMMLPLEDAAIDKKEAELGRKLTDVECDAVILEVCNEVRNKYENLPQVKADTDAVIDYIKDPQNGISLKRKKLKPYVKPVIDWDSKAIIVDFDGCLFDTSIDDDIRKNAKGKRNWDAIYKLIPEYKLYDGWSELLTWAKYNNLKIGIICDAQRELVEKTMKHFNLPFDYVVGFQPYLDYPNPIRGNQMLNNLNIREKQVLYIGTTKDSEKQARCCQFKFIGGKWGANEVMDLNVPHIDNPKEAIEIVEKKLNVEQIGTLEQTVKQKSKKDRVFGIIGAIYGDIAGSHYERLNTFPKKNCKLFAADTTFTDDTVLTVAIADAILHKKPFAETIWAAGVKYPSAGFGEGFKKWLKGGWSIQGNSDGDGSGMRISPVGFMGKTLDDVLEMAKEATIPTHNSIEGIKAAQAVAASVFLARNKKSKEEIKEYIKSQFKYNLDLSEKAIRKMVVDVGDDMVKAKYSIPVAIIAFLNSSDYEDAVRTAVSYGGDTDTVGCIAGAIAAAYYGIPMELAEQAAMYLPKEFLDIINEFDGTALSNHRQTPPTLKSWCVDTVVVYGSNNDGTKSEKGYFYTRPSRSQPQPLKGYPIRSIDTTMKEIKKDVERLVAKVNNEPLTTFVIENVGISKKTNLGIENIAPLFKPLIDKENVYFVKEYWDYYKSTL